MPAFDFILAGRYRLLAPLGEGGMASVYRARDLRLNRDVAVKVLREDLTRDPSFLDRFSREAQMVASLSHPHIVPVYDVGEESGTHFIVMEYVAGYTLHEEIARQGPLSSDRALPILRHVLEALGYAHQQGLIHRDVKPHNVLLTQDGTARLADFGIAHLEGNSATQTAAILGSAHYLSPEQSRGEPATVRSDIYACGVTLYEMLTGAPPFTGANALMVANQHLSTDPTLEALPPELRPIVRTALAKDPAQRFPSAGDFAAALPEGTTISTRMQPLAVRGAPPRPAESRPVEAEITLHRSARKGTALAAILLVTVVALIYVSTLPLAMTTLPPIPPAAYVAALAIPLLVGAFSWLRSRFWLYRVDSSAAVVQWGILSHHRFGVPIHQIATIELKQSVLDRFLGVGTVELRARDVQGVEHRLVLEDVARPRQAYTSLMRILATYARLSEERSRP